MTFAYVRRAFDVLCVYDDIAAKRKYKNVKIRRYNGEGEKVGLLRWYTYGL